MTLTLPGSLPGLLRRGSPVFSPRGLMGVPSPGVLCGDLVTVAFDDGAHFRPDSILLDLSNETGAFHARLWAGTDPERLAVIRAAGVDVPTGLPGMRREGIRALLADQAKTHALLLSGTLSPGEEWTRVRPEYAARWQALGLLVEDLLNEVERLEARPVKVSTIAPDHAPLACPKCGGTSWGGGTDADPRPWCNGCGEPQP